MHHRLDTRLGLREQLLLSHRPKLHRTVEDTAAARSDLLVAEPVDLVHELLFARCRENAVGMRVAPAGQNEAACCVDHGKPRPVRDTGQVGHRSEGGDEAIFCGQPGIVDRGQLGHGTAVDRVLASRSKAIYGFGVLDQQATHR